MSELHLRDLDVERWLNTEADFAPPSGRIVALHAFQMLCPGCVLHGVPQAQKLHAVFDPGQVAVLGLHTVFEHHEAMREPSLRAFLHEFRVRFPVGIDRPAAQGALPVSMRRFGLQGTPSWLIFDRAGALKFHHFGRTDDMVLAAEVARLALADAAPDVKLYRTGEC